MNQAFRRALVVEREFEATPEEVFDAWLDPTSLELWMRPGEMTGASVSVDVRVEGSFEIVMHGPDGDRSHSGVYKVIDRPRTLAFTWISTATRLSETLVTIELRPKGSSTLLKLVHERLPDEPSLQAHGHGWKMILDRAVARFGI